MAVVAKPVLTEAEYLARERTADFRSEFLRGEMFAMSGAKYPHNRVKENAARNLGNQLEGGPCFVLSSHQRVKISPTGLYTYPDILIVCGSPEFEDSALDTLLNPRVIFEVLSELTEAYDRGAKFAHYRQLASLEEYVLISQDCPLVERYLRQPDGTWVLTAVSGLEATLPLASVGARLTLGVIYAGLEMSETPGH
ncbi:MAG: Uma2 family endonuclease [Planctomycetes bacterium]|nr:Uma2 family endonuclease [Planctomycetota bacterium]